MEKGGKEEVGVKGERVEAVVEVVDRQEREKTRNAMGMKEKEEWKEKEGQEKQKTLYRK